MATLAEIETALRKADAAGDTDSAKVLAAEYRRLRAGQDSYQQHADRQARVDAQIAKDRALYDPTATAPGQWEATRFGQNMLEGIGAGMTSVLRAVGGGSLAEKLRLPATKEEADKNDAALGNTVGGTVGRVVGQAAPAALAIPFTPASLPVAAGAGLLTRGAAVAIPQMVAGGVTGGAMTEGGAGERLQGAAGGTLGGAVGSAIPAVYRVGKGLLRSLVEPATEAGRNRIVGRAIDRFATNPGGLGPVPMGPSITGTQLTLPEVMRDPGLMTLQRAVGTMDPQADAAIANRYMQNNAARVDAMERAAGLQPSATVTGRTAREAAELERAALSDPLYAMARARGWDPIINDPANMAAMERLAARFTPDLRAEATRRATLAGEPFGPFQPAADLGQAQWLGRALNARISKDLAKGEDVQELMGLKGAFNQALEDFSPELRMGNQTYAATSAPIDRMNVWQRLLDTTRAAGEDLGANGMVGVRQIQPGRLANALNADEQLIRLATGRGGARLGDVMTPSDLALMQGLREETNTLAKLSAAANGPGSQTAKMLNAQNLLRNLSGPMGIPDSWLDTTVGDLLMRGPNLAYKVAGANERVGQRLGEVLLDPAQAQQAVRAARIADRISPAGPWAQLARRSAPAAIGLTSADLASE